uniref:Secreted protein n=1 Tax=Parascaris univalens TaxID=6257 RepID=A0A915CC18_PARUN
MVPVGAGLGCRLVPVWGAVVPVGGRCCRLCRFGAGLGCRLVPVWGAVVPGLGCRLVPVWGAGWCRFGVPAGAGLGCRLVPVWGAGWCRFVVPKMMPQLAEITVQYINLR